MQAENMADMDREQRLRWEAEMQRQAEQNENFAKQITVTFELF